MTSNNLEAIDREGAIRILENILSEHELDEMMAYRVRKALSLLQADEEQEGCWLCKDYSIKGVPFPPPHRHEARKTETPPKPTKETKLERLERLKRGMFLGSQISSEEVLSEIVDILLEEEY